MDIPLLLAIASSIIIVIISLTFFIKSKSQKGRWFAHSYYWTYGSSSGEFLWYFLSASEGERPRPVANRPQDGAPRRAQLARNRGARLRANGEIGMFLLLKLFQLGYIFYSIFTP